MPKLTAAGVRSEARPGRHNDGDGLYLFVRQSGSKSWVLRYRDGPRLRDMGLGAYPGVSLAEARERARKAREVRRDGSDPIGSRRAQRRAREQAALEAEALAFQAVTERYISRHEASWRNAKHRAQWRSTLTSYVYPVIGKLHVAEINRSDVLRVLEPIWSRVPETASRVRGRMETILDFAAARGWRDATNPARWRDLRHDLPAASKLRPERNQAALPWEKMPEFMVALRRLPGTSARALEFLVLTAARTSEVLQARWREVDLEAAVWAIPASRTKTGKLHRVPLSRQAISVLRSMQTLATSPEDYLFPGQRPRQPLSAMALLMLRRRMQGAGQTLRWTDAEGRSITVHGFRATFRTWAGEATTTPREVVEAALAHTLKDKAEAAYVRTDLLERRRALMEAWSGHCGSASASDPTAISVQVGN
jgi:integrase